MTRYARAKRDQRVQEGNSTPWSEMVKTVVPPSNADNDEQLSKTAAASADDSPGNKVVNGSENSAKPKVKSVKSKFEKSLSSGEKEEKGSLKTFPTEITGKKKEKKRDALKMKAETANEAASEPQKKKKKLKKALAAENQPENSASSTIPVVGDANVVKKKAKKRKSEDIGAEVDETVQKKKKKSKKSKNGDSAEPSSTAPKKKREKPPPPPPRPPKFFDDIVKKIAQDDECKTAVDVKRKVRQMVKAGEIVGKEAGLVVRKWKTRERQRLHKETMRNTESTATKSNNTEQKPKKPKPNLAPKESSIKQKKEKPRTLVESQGSSEIAKSDNPSKGAPSKSLSDNELTEMADKLTTQTLDDVKQLVNSYVDSGKLSRRDAGEVVKKWKDRERRRVNRGVQKWTNAVCFHCRQSGHLLADCPNVDTTESGSGICFKCGSTEHKSSRCSRKDVKGFPFATCFVCKQQGHLSRDCEHNPNGIYPDGGSCNICGSQKHLRRDCPNMQESSGPPKMTITPMLKTQTMRSADDDDAVFYELDKLPVHNEGVKVVKF